ncbi:XRN 5'-3' exonuclease N-terminus-domain-containing protein [Lipomyces japonicus]|uniref:XRN 5'-3' exonuclease N-terminus-domain-containing protein n=1 Tax=Lipomyces japonicus TaxID=56871 RepID=UPI0034CF93D1
MGIPKFFRWISERYPYISQPIEGENAPEFDNLYLDMNGILHNCSHKDSDDATYRISEEQIYTAIFAYLEVIFDKIRPKNLLFMAIDGVAPRAKMNQQRSRRFRTALDAEKARQKAIKEGTELPKEPPFDTNAITPGTEFMARLTKQLHYFISKKVSEDSRWRNINIVLSGHEVPGEGEHKIMEYIRSTKSQPGYNPNIRHCFYGLDADLIMLGLVTHEPHFCLLREKVDFGRQQTRSSGPQQFVLLHLALVREYLEIEFKDVQHVISFPYNFEKLLDDFILLCFFVGNDFLPNLPLFHINEGVLSYMFEAYKKVLPELTGYLTDNGVINLEHFRYFVRELVDFEFKIFESENEDDIYLKSKSIDSRTSSSISLTERQRTIFESIESYVLKSRLEGDILVWELPKAAVEQDIEFIETLAERLSLDYLDHDGVVSLNINERDTDDDTATEEADYALQRVLHQYRSAPSQGSKIPTPNPDLQQVLDRFGKWKDAYYTKKFGFSLYDDQKVTDLCENYIEGLQWVLNYYYKGVCSWSWYFRYHYAPRISDITKGFNVKINFQLGRPFRPYDQLMAVLPDLSNKLIPESFRGLMHDVGSPILDFYPKEFGLDLNGKKNDWEAVVLIPFVDEHRLLSALKPLEKNLSAEEKKRNEYGKMLQYVYTSDNVPALQAPVSSFPDIINNKCKVVEYNFPSMVGKVFQSTLCDGALLHTNALAGFPTFYSIPNSTEITTRHTVNVFQQESKKEAVILTIENKYDEFSAEDIAKSKLGSRVFIGWPYLQEGLIIAVSDQGVKYEKVGNQVVSVALSQKDSEIFDRKQIDIYRHYARHGIDIGEVDVTLTVKLLKGMRVSETGSLVKDYHDLPALQATVAVQTSLFSVTNEDQRFIEKAAPSIVEQFPISSRAFYVGADAYGEPVVITAHSGEKLASVIAKPSAQLQLPLVVKNIVRKALTTDVYYPAYILSREFNVPWMILSQITATFATGDNPPLRFGLGLKFEKQQKKALGYARKGSTGWEFSDKARKLIYDYRQAFPQLFNGIVAHSYDSSRVTLATILNVSQDEAKKTSANIKSWIKKATAEIELVSIDSEKLPASTVELIEKVTATEISKQHISQSTLIEHVSQNELLKPSEAAHRLGNQKFTLGDRVCYTLDSGRVPIAFRGTVVGITEHDGRHALDVVFDFPFLGGTNLNGLCSVERGLTVDASSVLNISNNQLVKNKKKIPTSHQYGFADSHVVNSRGSGNGRGRGRGGLGQPAVNGRGHVNPGHLALIGQGQVSHEHPVSNGRGHSSTASHVSRGSYGHAMTNVRVNDNNKHSTTNGGNVHQEHTTANGRGRGRGGHYSRGKANSGRGGRGRGGGHPQHRAAQTQTGQA